MSRASIEVKVATNCRQGTGKLYRDQMNVIYLQLEEKMNELDGKDFHRPFEENWDKISQALIAVEGETVVGFMMFTTNNKDRTYVHSVAVHKDHRGKGVGTAMFMFAKPYFKSRGFKEVTLLVHAPNEAAIQLYRSMGFKPQMLDMSLALESRRENGKHRSLHPNPLPGQREWQEAWGCDL